MDGATVSPDTCRSKSQERIRHQECRNQRGGRLYGIYVAGSSHRLSFTSDIDGSRVQYHGPAKSDGRAFVSLRKSQRVESVCGVDLLRVSASVKDLVDKDERRNLLFLGISVRVYWSEGSELGN